MFSTVLKTQLKNSLEKYELTYSDTFPASKCTVDLSLELQHPHTKALLLSSMQLEIKLTVSKPTGKTPGLLT